MDHLVQICDGFVISNIGQLAYFENSQVPLIANYTMNVFNNETILQLENLNLSKITISPELTKEQIQSLNAKVPLELMAYGRQVVMTSEHCPVGSIVGGFTSKKPCSKPCIKDDIFFLKDRLGMKFRVLPDNIDCQSQILNSKITSIASKEISIDSIRIDLLDETVEEIQNIIDTHRKGGKLSGEDYTNGHINRPV